MTDPEPLTDAQLDVLLRLLEQLDRLPPQTDRKKP
jgi:hypothetical protein